MPSAIVTGATGITGSAIVHHLLKDPSYEKIFSLSRSNPGYENPRIKHATLDLQASASEMAKELADVSAEHVFFCAYLARDDPDEAAQVNSAMLDNFIRALEVTGAAKKLKRFVLTCGFKQYGVHLGHAKQPLLESDPPLENGLGGISWQKNFYYDQQQILTEAAARGNWEWVSTYPEDVLGYAKGNFMNEATALGLYCSVSKALPGSELPFPGCRASYFAFNCWTSANLHAKFCLWAANSPHAGNNAFNVINGDTESFQNLWPRLAARFGCKVPDPMFPNGGIPDAKGFKDYESTTVRMGSKHPLSAHAASLGLSSDPLLQQNPVLHLQVDPEKWAKREDVNGVWRKLLEKYGLDQKTWDKATWDFLTFVLGRDWSCVGSMSKARELGWTGYADTWTELVDTFEILEKEGVLPPVEKLKQDF